MPKRCRGTRTTIELDGVKVTLDSKPEAALLTKYHPLLQVWKQPIALFKKCQKPKVALLPQQVPMSKGRIWKPTTQEMEILQQWSIINIRPDFIAPATNRIVEFKGSMMDDFPPHILLLRDQHPDLFRRYCLVFQNPKLKVPNRHVTYGEWATNMQIPWAVFNPSLRIPVDTIPQEWMTAKTIGVGSDLNSSWLDDD